MFSLVFFLSAFRTIILIGCSLFSIVFVMLLLNIITIADIQDILNLSDETTNALATVLGRFLQVGHNLLGILSEFLNRLFGWAGMKVDLNTIKVNVNN
jgi:hypothetical protein